MRLYFFCGWIYKVIPLTNNRIASCSEDKTIKIWNSFEPYNLITTLNGHDKFINLLIELKGKNILISGSWDCTLRQWNLTSYQCDKIIKIVECSYRNSIFEIDDDRIIVGGYGGITIVNISSSKIEHQIKTEKDKNVLSFNRLSDGNRLCGCECGYICLYDVKLNTLTFKSEKIHRENVACILNISKRKFIVLLILLSKYGNINVNFL